METDLTIVFCDIYFSLHNRIICIILTNKKELVGYINGYYYEDLDDENKKIAMWHFVQMDEYVKEKSPQISNSNSLLLLQKHIQEIKYLDNHSNFQTINFIKK